QLRGDFNGRAPAWHEPPPLLRRSSPTRGPMYALKAVLSWRGLPVSVWQRVAVRLRTRRRVPPAGAVHHRVEGREPASRMLVLGDSSAAGVGVARSTDCLAP